MVLSPKESGEYISRLSKHVTINKEGVQKAAELLVKGFQEEDFKLETRWNSRELNPSSEDLILAIDWIFLIDTLNFSFWSEKGKKFEVTFHGKTYTGYWSLCAVINRAIEEGHNMTSPAYYSQVSLETLRHIFRSDSGLEVPLLKERHRILQETGKCLVEKFDSTFLTCMKMAKNSAAGLLKIVLDNFPSYRDEATIDGQQVSFYKRAQILVGDIWVCFQGKGMGGFEDIESLSIFADYRVPQALVYIGALSYSEELLKKLNDDELIENGDRYEVEIRGCTIWVCELIWQCIKEMQKNGKASETLMVNAILIDNYLWEYRRKLAKEMDHIPFHKVRCIYY